MWYIGRSHWVRDGCSAIIFVKNVRTVFVQVLHNAVRMHELLVSCESSRKCHHAEQTTPTCMDKNNIDVFYKTDCCAAIHGRIRMNNVPNESRIIMLSCTVISFVIFSPIFKHLGPIAINFYRRKLWIF